MRCPSCSTDLPQGARFCPTCGASQSDDDTTHEERRIATVVFADVVGFTSLSESADPEQIKSLVDRCFQRLVKDVEEFGGRIDKIIGDAIVALFGAPVAHEDDAERAVRAALRMQETLVVLREEFAAAVEMRIGVNTGEVLVGAFRAGGDYTAMGDAVNVASRLETSAQPGQVLVGALTHEATRHAIEYEPVGALRVKGRATVVQAWAATATLTRPGDRPARPRVPLVGRDAERTLMGRSLDLALGRGRSALLVLTGEAGIGKHRLAADVAVEAMERHNAVVGHGRSTPYGELNPTAPIADALLELCGVDTSCDTASAHDAVVAAVDAVDDAEPDPGERERLRSGVLEMTGLVQPTPGIDRQRARQEAETATITFLRALAGERPVMLALTGMHWADDTALALCDRLIEGLHDRPCVILVAGRSDLRDRWSPPPGRQVRLDLELEPLDFEATRELAAAVLGEVPDDRAARALFDRTGGNPFFVEELATLIQESDEAVVGAAEDQRSLPSTLHGLVAARLDGLPQDTHGIVEDAAVIGTRGPTAGVSAMALQRTPGDATDVARALGATELVTVTDGEYVFRSDVVRDVAYGRLTKVDRAQRHAWHASWLEEQAPDAPRPDDVRNSAAHHLGIAGELALDLGPSAALPPDLLDQARAVLRHAAQRAASAELWITVEHTVDRTLRLVDEENEELELRLLRAEARASRRRLPQAREDVEYVLAHTTDERTVAAARTRLGDIEHKEGQITQAAVTLDDAVQRWRKLGDVGNTGHALRLRGHVEFYRGDLPAAAELVKEALECFRVAGERGGEAWALQNLAMFSFLGGSPGTASKHLDAATAVFEELGDWGGLAWSRGLRAWLLFSDGDLDGAEALASRATSEDSQIGDRFGGAMNETLLASIALWRGNTARCIDQASAAADQFEAIGDAWGEATALRVAGRARLARGEIQTTLDDLARVRKLDESRGADRAEGFTDDFGVLVLALIGRPTQVLEELTDDQQISENLHSGLASPERIQATALVYLQAGRPDEAVAVLRQAARSSPDAPRRPALDSLMVLALLACGEVEQAAGILAESGDGAGGTYRDHLDLTIAEACLAVAQRDEARAKTVSQRAVDIIGSTDADAEKALTDLVVARVHSALGDSSGEAAAREVRGRLVAFGIDPDPWDRVYSAALGTTPTL